MKNFKHSKEYGKNSVSYYIIFLFILSVNIITGCSKSDSNGESNGPVVALTIKVEGVNSATTSSNLKASVNNSNYVSKLIENNLNQKSFTKDDLIIDVKSDQSNNLSGFENTLNKDLKSKAKLYAANTVPMVDDTKYRLLVYTAADVLVASIQAGVGEQQSISVTAGTTYKWYAYSYNNNTTIPAPNPNNPVLTTPTATPLLYASGQITPNSLGTILPITFKHQLTQLKVEIKESTGLRAILGATGEFSSADYVQTSTFDILTGAKIGNLTSANVTSLDFVNLIESDTVKRVAQYYTADEALTSYSVKMNSLNIQYTKIDTRSIDNIDLPNDGNATFTFAANPTSKKGYVLKGTLQLSFLLPTMNILTFSNNSNSGAYRIAPGTGAYYFLNSPINFGPTGKYVKTKGITMAPLTTDNLSGNADRIALLLTNPATYPDILIIANDQNYLSDASWDAVITYLNAGGCVIYTQDNATDNHFNIFLHKLFDLSPYGSTPTANRLNNIRPSESYTVYGFIDSPEAEADLGILNGPFGDVRPYGWGQDRVGTVYVTNYKGNDAIVYSTKAQNHAAPSVAGMASFRHKTKNFFFVGDGGFYVNSDGANLTGSSNTTNSNTENPFRIYPIGNSLQYQPGIARYGSAYNGMSAGSWEISNSMMFGNLLSWYMNKVQFDGIKRN